MGPQERHAGRTRNGPTKISPQPDRDATRVAPISAVQRTGGGEQPARKRLPITPRWCSRPPSASLFKEHLSRDDCGRAQEKETIVLLANADDSHDNSHGNDRIPQGSRNGEA